jgi:AraC family transcriptional regulator
MPWSSSSSLRVTLTSTGVATYPPGATFGPREMRDYEFVWVTEGESEYRWGDVVVPAPPGSIVLCRPGARDAFRWDPHHRTRHAYFHFNIEQRPATWPAEETWPLARVMPEGDILRPLFRHLLTWRHAPGGGDPLLRELTVAQMLTAYVLGHLAANEVAPHDALPDAVERALAFIHAALEDDAARAVTLDDLADAAACTREHLCRVFKIATGRSPAETVRLARLDRAAVLLARSNYSVGQIARLCGFASQFHFARRFKESFGRTPREVRTAVARGAVPPLPRLLRRT